jgi:hypothetical protein
MLKTKKIVSILIILSMSLLTIGTVPIANAASMTSAKDTLSTSVPSAAATHTVTFRPWVNLAVGDYYDVTLPAAFGTFTDTAITCPTDTNRSYPGVRVARCTATAPVTAATSTITIVGVTNPVAEGSQTIAITSYKAGGLTLNETANPMVAIINNVVITAGVPSTLTFAISPLLSAVNVNGSATTIGSATTTLAFGNLVVATPAIIGQDLKVTTNADNGFSVTVQQNQNLTNSGGSTIDAFKNGTPPAPEIWSGPTGTLDVPTTYGHMGLTSDDPSLATGDYFGANLWTGFNGATPIEVLYHDGPADGLTAGKGEAKVAYQVQISALQEAGDYTNTLIYIATPIF